MQMELPNRKVDFLLTKHYSKLNFFLELLACLCLLFLLNQAKAQYLPCSFDSYADKWLKCFRQSAKKVCDRSGIDFLEWVVEPYVSDALDLGCRKEWTHGTDSCAQ